LNEVQISTYASSCSINLENRLTHLYGARRFKELEGFLQEANIEMPDRFPAVSFLSSTLRFSFSFYI